jgi:hypothetical protein
MLQRVWCYVSQVNATNSVVKGSLDVFDCSTFPLYHMTDVQAFALRTHQMRFQSGGQRTEAPLLFRVSRPFSPEINLSPNKVNLEPPQ